MKTRRCPSPIASLASCVVACLASLASGVAGRPMAVAWDGPDVSPGRSDVTASQADHWQRQLASWGSDHVGLTTPEYITGDECLFCHRSIGTSWQKNPHQTTMRMSDPGQREMQTLAQCDPSLAKQVEFLLGKERLVRYLRRSQSYGRLDLLSASYRPETDANDESTAGRLVDCDSLSWDTRGLGEQCIGCHTTAADSGRRTFSATSLDCFTCHGEVVLEHSTDVSQVLLSRHPQNPLVVNSICGSCHLRGGSSQTSGLPYPNAFVPGDNLFRDFRVDLSDSAIAALPAMQQHIYLSARLVGVGAKEPTCTDCHRVHSLHTDHHLELKSSGICNACHVANSGKHELLDSIRQHDRKSVRNTTCGY